MKNILVVLLAIFALSSCKVSDSVTADQRNKSSEKLTVDQITKSSDLAEKKTFQVIEVKDATKNIAQVNRIFEKKLIENGFTQVDENPELLIQSVIASVDFETEVLGFSSTVGLTDSNSYSPPRTEHGQYGKVIFLIQDAKTNEVLWMGTGTGILTANEVLNSKEIKTALDQLIAGLK
jgi:TATA-box binding protein (TBP) (component of TFIID and TFIIIB)